jgi:hypothetical protein
MVLSDGGTMNNIISAAALAAVICLAPMATKAQERLGDAALGAVSGAVVAGPVGALAGGLVGLTAGPTIARSWGLRRHRYYRRDASTPAERHAAHCRDC